MKTATVRDAQHHLARLLAEVEKGEEIVLTRRGKQIGKLVPMGGAPERVADPEQRIRWLQELEEFRRTSGGDPSGGNAVLELREGERY